MKTNEEIRKLAKADFDDICVTGNALDWSVWKKAYYLGYKQGSIDALDYAVAKINNENI